MSNQLDCGLSLKDDIASIRTFHDVIIVCSDGVEIGACRAILASRSPFFKAMLYGNMQEATSNKVILHDIKSAVLHAVLQFIHTENIDSTAISVAIDVYRAANFLLLPNLMKLVLERASDIEDFEVATSLLNEATISLPWSENTKDLYDILLKPFYTHSLAVGDLNGLSEDALELLLVKSTEIIEFNTPEYDLLLSIVEWAWTRNATTQPAAERCAIFDAINRMSSEPSARILLGNGPSRASLLKMMQHVNLTLICPHRLKSLTEAVDVLSETSPQYLAFCHYACKNTKCSTGHPSELRGNPKTWLQWDQSKLANNLGLSEECAVVEAIFGHANIYRSVRTSTPCVAGPDGFCEWDIVVESNGFYIGETQSALGFVSESFDGFENNWIGSEWSFLSRGNQNEKYAKGVNDNFGCTIRRGDVITFHPNMNDCTCAISINGINHGIAWTNLPRDTKLYPAATLYNNSKYRIRPHIRL